MHALALLAAVTLADPLPPQNQPVNITQVSGTPVGSSVPVTCVSGCGGGSGGGGGASWDAGVIVQYPIAVGSLWDGGVLVENFPAVQAVSQASFPWITQIDPDAGPLAVACVSGCGGGSGGGGASWDAGVLVQNFPSSFGASQVGNWSVLIEYDGGPIPVDVENAVAVASLWDGGVLVQNSVTVLQGTSPWDVQGTVQVLQDSFPWTISGPVTTWDAGVEVQNAVAIASLWDGGVEVQNFPASFGATQSGNWSVLINYDGGALPVAGIVTADQGTVPWQVSQDGAWTALFYYDGGPLPVSGTVAISGSVSVTQGTSPWVVSDNQVEPDSGVPWVYVVNQSGSSGGGGGTVTQGPASSTPDSGWWVNPAAVINGGTSNVLCGNSDTTLGTFAGSRKSIEVCNTNPVNTIYICTATKGCSSPNSIDAGTVVGEPLAPGTCLSKATSLAMVCVTTSGQAQVSPDAGTVVVEVL